MAHANFEFELDDTRYVGITNGAKVENKVMPASSSGENFVRLEFPILHWRALAESIEELVSNAQKPPHPDVLCIDG